MVDILIIGGGINGAACARDAALRGFSVRLVDKYDFAFGASSKTSKLAHGGLRYLQQFEFQLVRESLKERDLLLKNAAAWVKPLAFFFPVYERSWMWLLGLGLKWYGKHEHQSSKHLLARFPGLKAQGLLGGYSYQDAMMEDARLVIENLKSAKRLGAEVINYADSPVREEARVVIEALGAWTPDSIPYKGVHLVINSIHPTDALILRTPQDKRIFFILPWHGYSLVGTTDTPFTGDPAALEVTPEETHYLLEAVHFYFPECNLQVISSFAGLRPLSSAKLSRRHAITKVGNTLKVTGGKFTTHRQVAEELIDKAEEILGGKKGACTTKDTPLGPKVEITPEYARAHEWAKNLDDWAYRRTPIGYLNQPEKMEKAKSVFNSTSLIPIKLST